MPLAPLLIIFTYLFYPAIWLLQCLGQRCASSCRHPPVQGGSHGELAHSQEELRGMLMQAVAAGTISKSSQAVLTDAFEFGQLKVRQIL